MHRALRSTSAAAVMSFGLVIVGGLIQSSGPPLQAAQAQNAAPEPPAGDVPRTPWGEPDLQGIWSVERLVPLQRPAGVTTEFYTEEQVAELDRARSETSVFGNHLRAEPGSEADVAGAYNSVFTSQRPTGRRTAMIIDPPDGRIPPATQDAQAQ